MNYNIEYFKQNGVFTEARQKQHKELMRNLEKASNDEELEKASNDIKEFYRDMENVIEDNKAFRSQYGDIGEKSPTITIKNNSDLKSNILYQRGKGEIKNMEKSYILNRSKEKYSDRFNFDKNENLSITKYLRGISTGNWTGAEAERRSATTSTMGAVVPTSIASFILESALNKSIFLENGSIVPMDTFSVVVPRVVSHGNPTFKLEGEATSEMAFNMQPYELKAKTLYGWIEISQELLMASDSSDSIIIDTFSKAIAEAFEKAILYTQGVNAPKGIFEDSEVLKISVNGAIGYDALIDAKSEILKKNITPHVMAVNSITKNTLDKLKTPSGEYISKPSCLDEYIFVESNALNENNAIVFNRESLLIGIMNQLVITQTPNIENNTLKIGFACYCDSVVAQPNGLCKIEATEEAAA